MAEAIVSSVLNALDSIIRSEIGLVSSNRQELQNLSTKFTGIKVVLRDAEKKQRSNTDLRDWLDELKDVAYDVNDLLDEWRYETLRFEIEGSGIPTGVKKICNFFLRCLCFDEQVDTVFFHLKLGMQMKRRVKTARERLDAIFEMKSNFRLEESSNSGGETGFMVAKSEIIGRDGDERRIISWLKDGVGESSNSGGETDFMVAESEIIGRDGDKKRIISWLLGGDGGNISAIFIFGVAGVGKTAIAQLIYNDGIVKEHFTVRIWVPVSRHCGETKIWQAINRAVTGHDGEDSERETVPDHLIHSQGQRLLLVLDGVCYEDYLNWERLRETVRNSTNGSKILITTRDSDVAEMNSLRYRLPPLSESNSQSLLNLVAASRGVNPGEGTEQEIGREIAIKCGLPRDIKIIGKAMHFMTGSVWKHVLNCRSLKSPPSDWLCKAVERFEIYDNMPSHLKQCLIFCFVFPWPYSMQKEMLIKLWMAQGFLHSEEGEELEIIGDQYFNDLPGVFLSKDFSGVSWGSDSTCKMRKGAYNLFKIFVGECRAMYKNMPNHVLKHARHLSSVFFDGDLPATLLETLCNARKLRSLLFEGRWTNSQLSDDFCNNFRSLRALDLSKNNVPVLPASLKNLKLLRYLDLSHTDIQVLSDFISEIYLLQTLKLNGCHRLRQLPENMRKLTSLRYLEIEDTPNLKVLPLGIGKLTSLRILSKFIVGDVRGSGIEELGNLNSLRGELAIMHLERVLDEDNAKEAKLMDKNIRRLKLISNYGGAMTLLHSHGQSSAKGVFEGLRPHEGLEELEISGYRDLIFPSWVGDSAFTNLIEVRLSNCPGCSELPPLGTLPKLQCLTIEQMDEVKSIGPEIYGGLDAEPSMSFRSLEKLVLRTMRNLQTAFSQELSSLRELYIVDCPLLMTAPFAVHPRLTELHIESRTLPYPSAIWLHSKSIRLLYAVGLEILNVGSLSGLVKLVIENSQDQSEVHGLERLSMLGTLHIKGQGMRKLPWELRTPIYLRELHLDDCPELQQRCQSHDKEFWHLMPRVHHIRFGDHDTAFGLDL